MALMVAILIPWWFALLMEEFRRVTRRGPLMISDAFSGNGLLVLRTTPIQPK